MKKIKLISLMMLLLSTSIFAWDGERKGFLLGLGFGAGLDVYKGIQWDAIGSEKERISNNQIDIHVVKGLKYFKW